jgi:hypothetical protein
MYFLTNGIFELREYREDDIQSFKIAPLKNLITATNKGGPLQKEAWAIASAELPTFTVGWLAEFCLFETRSHDTMLLARGYCEVLHVARTPFQALLRKFPSLESMMKETNQTRKAHATLLMGSEAAVGDWIRPYRSRRFKHALSMHSSEEVSRLVQKEAWPGASSNEGGPWPQSMDNGNA